MTMETARIHRNNIEPEGVFLAVSPDGSFYFMAILDKKSSKKERAMFHKKPRWHKRVKLTKQSKKAKRATPRKKIMLEKRVSGQKKTTYHKRVTEDKKTMVDKCVKLLKKTNEEKRPV